MSQDKPPRRDPLPVYCFQVTLTQPAGFHEGKAFFKSVSGLKYETEVVDVRVGGLNQSTLKLPGSTKFGNIVLKRGFTSDTALVKWRELWLYGTGARVRCDGTIVQLDNALQKVCSWKFLRAWPCKWELTEFDASKNELGIETLELAHEGLSLE